MLFTISCFRIVVPWLIFILLSGNESHLLLLLFGFRQVKLNAEKICWMVNRFASTPYCGCNIIRHLGIFRSIMWFWILLYYYVKILGLICLNEGQVLPSANNVAYFSELVDHLSSFATLIIRGISTSNCFVYENRSLRQLSIVFGSTSLSSDIISITMDLSNIDFIWYFFEPFCLSRRLIFNRLIISRNFDTCRWTLSWWSMWFVTFLVDVNAVASRQLICNTL